MRNTFGFIVVLSVALLGLSASLASADTIVLQDGLNGYDGTTDVFIRRNASTSNVSSYNYTSVNRLAIDIWGSPFPPDYQTTYGQSGSGMNDGNNWYEGLLKFDDMFDSIDPMSIESATLTLQIVNGYEKPSIWRMTTPWTETGASWDFFDGDGNGSDISDHPSDGGGVTVGVNTLATSDYPSGAYLNTGSRDIDVTAAVQAWLADPSSNQGWVFINDNPNRGLFVASEEPTFTGERPMLTIEFTPVPEPGSILLLGIGAMGLLAVSRRNSRRRR